LRSYGHGNYGNDEYLAQVERSKRRLEDRRRQRRQKMFTDMSGKPSPISFNEASQNYTLHDYADLGGER
jgi:hypothetical protein